MDYLIYIFVTIVFGAFPIFDQTNAKIFHREIAWSPDGQRVSFTTYRKLEPNSNQIKSEIYIMNADGSNQQKIAEDTAWSLWSKDSQRILFSKVNPASKALELYTIKTDGTDLIQLKRDTK